ncbi:MAG: ATP-binding cassette domain-containing protein [Spirochaetia bacterium]|nr:ATP-binding cassette domain-containing protein [Spirochaetia bacterium]
MILNFFRKSKKLKGFKLKGLPCYEIMSSIVQEGKKVPLITFEKVYYTDNITKKSLKNITFSINPGESVVFIGPENSGKELILDLIIAKTYSDKGDVFLFDRALALESEEFIEKMRSCIGVVSHSFGLINNLSAKENILLPLRYHTILNEKGLQSIASRYLKKFHLLDKENLRPQLLNYSEKFKTAFIRAVISKPQIVLIEDAIDGQCPISSASIINHIKDEKENFGTSFLISAYNPSLFYGLNARFILIYDGRILFDGSEDDFKRSQNAYVKQYLYHPLKGPMNHYNLEAAT